MLFSAGPPNSLHRATSVNRRSSRQPSGTVWLQTTSTPPRLTTECRNRMRDRATEPTSVQLSRTELPKSRTSQSSNQVLLLQTSKVLLSLGCGNLTRMTLRTGVLGSPQSVVPAGRDDHVADGLGIVAEEVRLERAPVDDVPLGFVEEVLDHPAATQRAARRDDRLVDHRPAVGHRFVQTDLPDGRRRRTGGGDHAETGQGDRGKTDRKHTQGQPAPRSMWWVHSYTSCGEDMPEQCLAAAGKCVATRRQLRDSPARRLRPEPWLRSRIGGPPMASRHQPGRWVLLSYRLPREPSTPRITPWRKLERLGVARLGDGLVGLPADARTREQFDWLAAEILEADGTATVWLGSPASNSDEDAIVDGMRAARAAEYDAIIDKARAAATANRDEAARALRRLRDELQRITRRDFFPPPQRDRAHAAVEAISGDARTERPARTR